MAPIADLWIWAVPALAIVLWLSRSKLRTGIDAAMSAQTIVPASGGAR
jgi:hypothetical protein